MQRHQYNRDHIKEMVTFEHMEHLLHGLIL